MQNHFKCTPTLFFIKPKKKNKHKIQKGFQPRFLSTRAYSFLFIELLLEIPSSHNGARIWLTFSLPCTMASYPETQACNGVRYHRTYSKHSSHRRTQRPDWNPLTPLCIRHTVGETKHPLSRCPSTLIYLSALLAHIHTPQASYLAPLLPFCIHNLKLSWVKTAK